MVIQCGIDADVLRYEIGFAAEASWKYMNEGKEPEWFLSNPPPWNLVDDLLTNRIRAIETTCDATEPSILYFTGSTNFRNAIATTTPYKQRAGIKPYHFRNIEAYLKSAYAFFQVEGLEADDLMAIHQTARIEAGDESFVICTRDKDLRAVDGMFYSWELGEQPSFGPCRISGYGSIVLAPNRKKLIGTGTKFFLSQCLTGDVVDSIPGLPGIGPAKAFPILEATSTYAEGLEAVREAYKAAGKDDEYLLEQGRLLWMTRHLNEDGSPILWSF